MIVDEIHEIISHRQSNCLEKYINFNTQKSLRAKFDIEKEFYKLLNTAIYGKTMEKVRNRIFVEFFKKMIFLIYKTIKINLQWNTKMSFKLR